MNLFWKVPFSIGKLISFNLGITGGVLLAGIFLSNRGKVGPVVWQVPAPITSFMRELGLVLFLAVVGIHAGGEVFETIKTDGLRLILFGVVITLLPMIVMCRSVALFMNGILKKRDSGLSTSTHFTIIKIHR